MLQNLSLHNEEWKDIPGYEGLYKISDLGRIYHVKKERLLTLSTTKKKYVQVRLSKNGEDVRYLVGRLVGTCFHRPPLFHEEINHKNGIKWDNRKVNVEWKSHLGNMQHAVITGLKDHKGAKHHAARKVIDTESKKIYDTVRQAAKENNIGEDLLCMYLRGTRKNKTTLAYLENLAL